MKIFRVVGNVTLSRCHPGFQGATLLAAEPEILWASEGSEPESPDLLIVWDDRGAGVGDRIAVSDGAEAAQAFRPELKAVDAYSSAILDNVHIDHEALQQLDLKS